MPYVGMNADNIGKQVGAEIASSYKAEGWDKDWSTVRVGSVEDQKADTCMRRNRGAEEAFLAAVPDFPKENDRPHPLRQHHGQLDRRGDHDADREPGRSSTGASISCNDDGVLGAVRATENAGMRGDGVIGVGIDGVAPARRSAPASPAALRGTMWLEFRQPRCDRDQAAPRAASRTASRCRWSPTCRPES